MKFVPSGKMQRLTMAARAEGSLRYRVTRELETRAIQQVDHVFTICEGLRADIVARGIPADKVTVIPNAVDIDSFHLASPPDPELQKILD